MAERRLAITKKSSLAGIAEGWDESCYAIVTAATVEELVEFSKFKGSDHSEAEWVNIAADFVKHHFVSGRVLVLGQPASSKKFVLADMQLADISQSIDIVTKLLADIAGVNYDPKDTGPAASSEPQPTNSAQPTANP